MSGLAGYYDNNFPAQQAVNSYSNVRYVLFEGISFPFHER